MRQRFGLNTEIIGIDIWEAGINRAQQKLEVLELDDVMILNQSAVAIALEEESVDLVTSNLGVNNFDDKEKVYAEVLRILQPDGRLCITTNPIGTFKELFELFSEVLQKMKLKESLKMLEQYVQHRGTKASIVVEFENAGFQLVKSEKDNTRMRFVDSESVFNHSLIRIGFRAYWEQMVGEENWKEFVSRVLMKIMAIIEKKGEFQMNIPMLYLEFKKKESSV